MVMTIMVMITFDDEEGLSMLVKLLMSYTCIFFTMPGTSTSKEVKRRRGNMEKVEEKDQEKGKNITTLHTLKSSKAMQ